MDEFEVTAAAQDYGMPAWESEYGPPDWEREFTPPAPEDRIDVPPDESARSAGGKKKIKRLIRYAATAAVVGVMALEAAPAPLETVDVESYIEISCAAVMPEEPVVLRFEYLDYRSLYDEVPSYGEEDFRYYIVYPDGREQELTVWNDTEYYRAVYCPEEVDFSEAVYSSEESEDSYFSLNIGSEVRDALIEPYREGTTLKIVCSYKDKAEGVIKRMTSMREIGLLPRKEERTVTVEVTPGENGLSEVEFRAVLHPQEDEDFEYVFGQQAFSQMSFCTRWYDAQGDFLGEGWCLAAPSDGDWPFPDAWLYGRDFVFIYQGPVRSSATDSAAAYYSLEMQITEESTGWHYIFESELIPVTTG